jgi:hypothetical protein
VWLVGIVACWGVFSGAAFAAITHEYDKGLSEAFSEGVPAGCAVSPNPRVKEPPEGPCLSGALTGANAITVDEGHAWVADQAPGPGGGGRVDRFNAATGAFEGPQLDEEGGASELGRQLGVGHAFFLSEQVYVDGAHQIAVYDGETGKLAGLWAGSTALGSGELTGMAVDDTPVVSGDPDAGDVYVATKGSVPADNVVRVLDPEEVTKAGEEPKKLVAELTGTCANENEELPCSGGSNLVPFPQPLRVAVSPVNGDVFVEQLSPSEIDVFEPVSGGLPGAYKFLHTITGTPTGPGKAIVPLGRAREMAVDGGTGELYVVEDGAGVVDEFGPAGAYLSQIPGTPSGRFPEGAGVGVDGVTHDVLVGNAGGSPALAVFGADIPIPDVEVLEPPEGVTATGATLRGEVDPDGNGEASCEFEYGLTSSYGNQVECEHHVPNGPSKVEVHSKRVGDLQPDMTYHYRLDGTSRVNGHTNDGNGAEDEGTFTTTGPGLHGESVSEVASTAVSLDATINPNGLPTSYYFQYVDPATEGVARTEACPPTGTAKCPTIPATPEALGSVSGDQHVSQRLQGLSPGHEYHYRVLVVSEPPGEPAETFTEPDKTFTTQPPASGFALPDGREWELVTPPDKHGATPRERSNGVTQASLSGGAISYLTTKPIEEDAPGYGVIFEQVLSTRGRGGWESQDISAPHAEPPQATAGEGYEYRTFSEDFSSALVEPFGEFTSLKPDVFPPDTEPTPYLRHDFTCASSPSTCYEPLLTAAPGYADVPPGTHFGPTVAVLPGWSVMATTPDLTHVILGETGYGSKQPLKNGGSPQALYEWSAGAPFGEGQLQLVSVLPDGTPTSGTIGTASIKESNGNAARAVSDDGARVVWINTGDGGLYLTDTALPETATQRSVRLDVPEAGCHECGGGNVAPILQTMNNEGSRVFFSDKQQLLPGAGAGEELYECAIVIEAGAPRCELHAVAPGAGLLGTTIVGASEDGDYIYFVSNAGIGHGAVNGNCATGTDFNSHEEEVEWKRATPATACNLYMVHYASGAGWEPPVLVGVLSGDDVPAWAWKPDGRPARVSPDGQWLAFMSNRSLTGYDNRDMHSGRPDEEVFLYHARSGAAGGLVCASCDPTGARPAGFEVGEPSLQRLATSEEWPKYAWLAGSIPGWTGYTLFTALYQSRYLFDSGRLFFNSSDALVPQDVNSQVDVYEYEPPNTAPEPPPNDSCTTDSATYNIATGGCVNLISSGTSHQESGFYDASATGDDAFFLTTESLVPQDPGGALSIYDAHVCNAEGIPCTQATATPAECTTTDACRTAPSPQPGIFGAPATATFTGPGNLGPAPAAVKPKTAAQIRAEKLAKALKSCHGDKKEKKRQACETAAHEKYAKKASAKPSSRKGRR